MKVKFKDLKVGDLFFYDSNKSRALWILTSRFKDNGYCWSRMICSAPGGYHSSEMEYPFTGMDEIAVEVIS